MYEELVKRLRRDATAFTGFVMRDISEAADAIEALSKMETTTNADRIRQMKDDELADELLSISAWPEKAGALYEVGAFESAWDAIMWWLKQEADHD